MPAELIKNPTIEQLYAAEQQKTSRLESEIFSLKNWIEIESKTLKKNESNLKLTILNLQEQLLSTQDKLSACQGKVLRMRNFLEGNSNEQNSRSPHLGHR